MEFVFGPRAYLYHKPTSADFLLTYGSMGQFHMDQDRLSDCRLFPDKCWFQTLKQLYYRGGYDIFSHLGGGPKDANM